MTAPLAALAARWRDQKPIDIPGHLVVPPPLRAFFLAGLASKAPGPILAIVPGERDAEDLADDIELFLDGSLFLPPWETLPFEHVSPNVGTMAARAAARHALRSGEKVVVVASVRGAVQRISPSPTDPVVLRVGDDHDFEGLVGRLAAAGYDRTDRVESRGEFAVRGGIIDLYPAQGREPVRVDFWGDRVEEITTVSVTTQRSIGSVAEVAAFPAREVRPDDSLSERARSLASSEPWAAATWDRVAEGVSFPGIESWLPWLADAATVIDEADASTRVVLFEPSRSHDRARDLAKEESELAAALAPTWGSGAPEAGEHPDLFLPIESALPTDRVLEAPSVAGRPGEEALSVSGFDAEPGNPESVARGLGSLVKKGLDVVVAMDGDAAADRVARVLAEEGLALHRGEEAATGSMVIAHGIHRGFVAPDLGVAVLGEQEIAGRRRAHRRARAAVREVAPSYGDLRPGDFVVHHHHGIGRFEGLVTNRMGGIERDYLLIAYAGQDRLYVPTDQLAAVRPYTGGESPRLSRMGGADWERTRGKVRKAVAAVAEEVVALHRKRARASGTAFAPDTPWQREMEAAFPFEETPDQLTAISEVKQDMEAEAPMDRLVFGDVGFGKTEVAIRAAFKAVQDGKQAAVLVPTTLLAQQHHQTFADRFAGYPVRVEMLSRFLTPHQQRTVVRGVAEGAVDVVIGTHRLLSEDISFRDLGLLVVDEEQRFGVSAKDQIKALRESVDVLTLTATPIPRTLEMALTGIRSVSRISTPPEDRHPILTFVGPYEEQTVSAAIRREMLREGQVFYVHNRIQSIDHAVTRLRALVPEARYAVAHGRMSEGQLEQVMLDFWNGEYDVLVATTIIESGLDLPQVNTLIVERADLLGLAQLYQLRGRVGRSSQRAYAYLFHPEDQRLTEEAYRRLEAIGEFGDLGSGFQLALRDLEIRGAGSVLGNVQSGHISAVGFDLYIELVAEAVEELETGSTREKPPAEVRIELPVEAHLPDDYVPDQDARLEAYRRLAAATSHASIDDVVAEWTDRYGELPERAEVLIDIARLRVEALRVGIAEIVAMRREVRLSPVTLSASKEVRLERIAPKAVLRDRAVFVPLPPEGPATRMADFIRTMWPPEDG
ncbi:MAG TPA: transcription-repair coupling factor [Acidimicrobiia bacterium]|nr:transcription-repair coupling factor [Acidimicrobiia bacterium]